MRHAAGLLISGNLTGRTTRGPEAAYMQGMGTTAAWQDGTEWRALRDHQYTYAVYHRDRSELLFDNQADPYQLRNLAPERSHGPKLTHYRGQLQRWMKEHNDTFEACTWYRDRWTSDRNITDTATGVKQDLGRLKTVVGKTAAEIANEDRR